jgi:hypothetical protein
MGLSDDNVVRWDAMLWMYAWDYQMTIWESAFLALQVCNALSSTGWTRWIARLLYCSGIQAAAAAAAWQGLPPTSAASGGDNPL